MKSVLTNSTAESTDVPAGTTHRYDFYGLVVEVTSDHAPTAASVDRDWKYFPAAGNAAPQARVSVSLAPPPFAEIPDLEASLVTPRNVCYRDGDLEYLDYFGRGLARIDRSTDVLQAWSEESDLLREIVYLYLLSRVGEHVDTIGKHRIHALGIRFRERGMLLLLPSGGGKSTMALRLLSRPDIEMLSEDTPLVSADGMLHPFPLRLGIRAGNEPAIPPEFMQTVGRIEFGPKTLIDLDYFGGRVAPPTPASTILIGVRHSGTISRIEPMPRRQVLSEIVANLVVGVGVYQGIEFILQSSWWELVYKIRPAWSRLRAGLGLLRRAHPYRFVLGRDREENYRCLVAFLENDQSG